MRARYWSFLVVQKQAVGLPYLYFLIFYSMAVKLYVGGLPWATTDEELSAAFAQAGTVTSSTVMKDKFTGRSRGFGFIEMATQEEATAAVDMWHGKELAGRTLTVNEARPLEDRPPRREGGFGGGRGGFGGGDRGGFGGGRGGFGGGGGGRGGFGGGRPSNDNYGASDDRWAA